MLLTVYCVRRDLSEVTFSLQVDADFELHNFRALCELESGIPAAESQLVHAERPLTDNHRSLASYGLKDGDVVILRQKENADPRPAVQFPNLPRIDFSSIAVPGTSSPRQRPAASTQQPHSSPGEIASSPQGLDNPALLRDMLLANPHELSLLKERNPPLAEALLSGDLERFSRVLVEQQQDRARRERERIRLFSADPFDLEAQAKIEEDIRQQNIEENMTIAMEEAPESFGQVVMLYINCKVNGHPVKAFVDSGAQMTIMSQACAERCNIMRLVDRRWAGIAKGVGTQKIIGRVHLEKSGKESTSLGMSSLPTSDGLTHPAHSSGPSPGMGDPPSLARSASASVCPFKPSDPDSIEPEAVEASKTSSEIRMSSKKKELLQELSDHAFSADQRSAMPLHNSSKEAVIRDNLEKCAEGSTQGLKLYLHTRQEASLSVTTTRMHEPLMLIDKKGCHPENQNLHQLNGLQQHTEPGNKQQEVQQDAPHDQGHLCDLRDLPLPKEEEQEQQKGIDLEALITGDRLQQNMDPSTEKSFLSSGYFGCSSSEMLMEIDLAEQTLVTVLNSAGRQNANVKNTGVSSLISDNPLMEVETSKYNPSSESGNNSTPPQALQPPESNVEMSGTNNECGKNLPSQNLCGSCKPSVDSTEESCSSVTAALKELHELLISSSKPTSENTSEVTCQSETVPKGQTGIQGLSERWAQNENLPHRDPCPEVSCHQAGCVSVKTENLGAAPGPGMEDKENTSFQGPGSGLSADKEGVLKSRESVSESSSVTVTSAKSSNQLHCTLGVEISPSLAASEEDALNQTSEHTESLPSNFILVKDLGPGIQNPIIDRPEIRENACPGPARPFLELEPPSSHPPSSPSRLPPLVFPATDIDRILRAGFTLQEALGALHRVGGNADLALLVLLAKNIVVPT
ncbi:regulatory solute carrier protein family 1 member 1 isoform X2 [Octodon degus]|uniref:Regulatory solute carrier protein family 1 member 1 isoform X2 n=1 Tax=Octodon degus TaxID=10160 RepID=A0A6P6F123_OCTDE|nr:regulatory solute carrier protein family 1 member 1 isoform X2 [Octodon degus]